MHILVAMEISAQLMNLQFTKKCSCKACDSERMHAYISDIVLPHCQFSIIYFIINVHLYHLN